MPEYESEYTRSFTPERAARAIGNADILFATPTARMVELIGAARRLVAEMDDDEGMPRNEAGEPLSGVTRGHALLVRALESFAAVKA